jgi:ABC-type cobalt transport system substrate-binding protein
MSEDLKSVGVSEISFMLGYEQTVFQKIIIEYILGYSRSRK